MSYQVLARKWRPGTFAEMVGQQHVLQALVNALESGRLHHAYLFTGTRGVGKTTVARILAKCLNCDQGVSPAPCGECGACAEIAEGRSIDLIEVDAASKTKVEDTRELLENVQYTPTRARYKIYLIDEVHMLSNHSFNALLKTLEEPPPHAIFLLATTDPQKLPATVLSRCLQFNLKNMQPEQIVAHLETILAAESVPAEPQALSLIARAAEGSMRDALSLTDQAIAFGEGHLKGPEVREMLGSVDRGQVLDLVAAILEDDPRATLALVANIAEHAADFISTLDELSNVLHQMTIAQVVPDALDTSWPDQAKIVELASRATVDDTQLFWQMAVSGRRDVHLASSARAGLEMVLLRMIAFRPTAVIQPPSMVGATPAKKPEPPATPVGSVAGQAAHTASPLAASSHESSGAPSLSAHSASVLTSSTDGISAGAEEVAEASPAERSVRPPGSDLSQLGDGDLSESNDHAQSAGLSENKKGGVLAAIDVPKPNGMARGDNEPDTGSEYDPPWQTRDSLNTESWPELFERFRFNGILHNIALHLEFSGRSDSTLRFTIAESEAALLNDRHPGQLTQALNQQLGDNIEAEIAVGAHSGRTPASYRAALAATQLAAAESAMLDDDALHGLLRAFDGEIIPGSLRPSISDVAHEGPESERLG
jgi:DNA polymerase III subunit gamma/tau